MDIAFIISTDNAAHQISATLEQFHAVRHLRYEVVVTDNGSSDQTRTIAQAAGVKVKALPDSLPGSMNSCRNRGAEMATAELLWFCSSTVELRDLESFADEAVHYFHAHPETVAMIPLITLNAHRLRWSDRLRTVYINARYYILNRLLKLGAAPEDCFIVRQSAFAKVQGFNPITLTNGHSELARRLVKLGDIRLLWHRRAAVVRLS